ncbi:hypothetical protein M0P48_00840 [Candidatus Gracilibacteria bacterium]|jgi:hypothetical protein|nr:hypothetical protein [Candidatus Gracilibacteria bacterium]
MKKEQVLKTLQILVFSAMVAVIAGATVYAEDAPPGVSSPFGADDIIGGTSDTATEEPVVEDTTVDETDNAGETLETTVQQPVTTQYTEPTTAEVQKTTTKKTTSLPKTGPETALLVVPSLVAGYFVVKGLRK